jgi:LmbE family N-acetylglucosaminyl deacetylase
MKDFGFSKIETVLFLGPHPDDAEFSSGGTISKMLENGLDIHYAVFSMCEKSIPKNFAPGSIKEELFEATSFLGIKRENLHLFDYEVRVFPQYRQEILEDLIKLRAKLKPDLVFVPSSTDIHQDHKTIYEEGVRAFKNSCLLGYEMPWNNFTFNSNLFVTLEERHLEKKINTLKFYKTQLGRPYSSDEYTRSLMKFKAIQIQEELCETFEILRWKI